MARNLLLSLQVKLDGAKKSAAEIAELGKTTAGTAKAAEAAGDSIASLESSISGLNAGDAEQLAIALKAAEDQAAKSAAEVERLKAAIASTPQPGAIAASVPIAPPAQTQSQAPQQSTGGDDALEELQAELDDLFAELAFDEVGEALTASIQKGFDGIKTGGLLGLLTAPLTIFGSLAQSILGGAGFGVAQKFSDRFGEGLTSKLEQDLSPVIGSFELLGEAAAVALEQGVQTGVALLPKQFGSAFGEVQSFIDSISDDALRGKLNEILGIATNFSTDLQEEFANAVGGQGRIDQAGLAVRGQASAGAEQELEAAREQAQKEFAAARKSFDDFSRGATVDLSQVQEQLAATRENIEDLNRLEQQLNAQIDAAGEGSDAARQYLDELNGLVQARDRQNARIQSLERLLQQDPQTLQILDGLIREQRQASERRTAELEAAQAELTATEQQTFETDAARITAIADIEARVQRLTILRENEAEALNRLLNLAASSSQGGTAQEIERLEQNIQTQQQAIDNASALLARNDAGEVIAIDTAEDIERRELQFSLVERLQELRQQGDRLFLAGEDSADNEAEIARLEEQLAAVNALLARDQVAELGATISGAEASIAQSTERIEELRRIQAERDNRLAELRAQTVAANAALQSVQVPDNAIPEPVRAIANRLSQLTGQSFREEQLPDLAIADEFLSAEGSNSRYQASLNRILVTQELFDAIHSGTLSSEQAFILSEELASAFAGDFGSFDGTNRIASGQVNRAELQKLRDSVEGSSQILEELSRYPEEVRELEEYTKLLALKAVQDLEREEADQSLRNFAQNATGALAQTERTVVAQRALLDSVERIAAEQGVEVGDLVSSLRQVIDGVVAASQDVRGAIASQLESGNLDQAGQAAVQQQLAAIQQAQAAVTARVQEQARLFQALEDNSGAAINLDGLRNVVGDDLVDKVTDALDLQKRLNQTLASLAQTEAGQNVTAARAQVEQRLEQVSGFFQAVNGAIAKVALNDDGEIKNAQLRAIGDLVTERFDALSDEAERVNNAVVARLRGLAESVTTNVGNRVGAVRDSAASAVGGAAQRVGGAVGNATAPARDVIDAQLAGLSSQVEAQKERAIAFLNRTIGETLTEEVLELVKVQQRLNDSLEQLNQLGDSDQAQRARAIVQEKLGDASEVLLTTTRAIGDFIANSDGDSIRGDVEGLRASIRDRFDGFKAAIDSTQETIETNIRQLREQAEAALAPRSFGERVQQVAGGAVASVRGAVSASRSTIDAGRTVGAAVQDAAQSDRGQGVLRTIGNTANALVRVGSTGLKVAEAFESVALDVVPFGRALKTVTQQVALPAAGAVAAAQIIPGADQLLPAIQAGAAGVINPLVQGGVADLTAQASGIITQLPGFLQNAAGSAATQVISGLGAGVETIAVNGATVAIAGAGATLAGRAGGVVAARAGQQVAQSARDFVSPASSSDPVPTNGNQAPTNSPQAVIDQQVRQATDQVSQVVQSVKDLASRFDQSFDQAAQQVENSLRAGATGLAAIQQQQSAAAENQAIAQIDGVLAQLRAVGADAADIALIEQERDRIATRQAELRAKVAAATAEAAELGDVVGLDNLSDDIGEAFGKVLATTNRLLAEFADVEAQARLLDTAKAAATSPTVRKLATDATLSTVATGAGLAVSNSLGADGPTVAGVATDFVASLVGRLGLEGSAALNQVLQELGETAEFKAATNAEKAQLILNGVAQKLGNTADELGTTLFGDITGFITGNSVGIAANAAKDAVPGLGAIPLPGAIAATQVVPQLQKLRSRIQDWADRSSANLAADTSEAEELGAVFGLDNRAVEVVENALERIPADIARTFSNLGDTVAFFERVFATAGNGANAALKELEQDLSQAAQRLLDLDERVEAGEFAGRNEALRVELTQAKSEFDRLQQAYAEAAAETGEQLETARRQVTTNEAPQQAQRPIPSLEELNNQGELFDVDGFFGRLNQIVNNFNDQLEKTYRQRFTVLGEDLRQAIAELDAEFEAAQASGDNGRAIAIGNTRARLAEQARITGGLIEGDVISPQQIQQLDEAEREIRRIYRLLERDVPDNLGPDIAKQASVAVRSLKGLGLALGGVFSAQQFIELGRQFTEFLRGVLTEYAEFQETVQLFGVVSGSLETEEFEQANAVIKELGATTTKTAQDAATAAVELAKAGFSANAVAASLSTVINVSEATTESIERVTEVLGSALNQYGLLSENQEELAANSQRVGDILVATANNSATDVNAIGESYAYLASQAVNANQSVEESAVLIGLAASAGIRGSAAGTGLAESLRRVQLASASATTELETLRARGSERAVAAFERLNLEVTDAQGQLKPMTEILADVKAGLEGFSDGDQALILNALFGVQGGRTASAINNLAQETVDQVSSSIRNSAGAAEGSADALTQGFAGSLKLLQSAIAETRNDLGEIVAEVLLPFIQALTKVIETIGAIPTPIQKALLAGAGLAATVTLLTGAIAAYTLASDLGVLSTIKNTASTTKQIIAKIALGQAEANLAAVKQRSDQINRFFNTTIVQGTAATQQNTAATVANATAQQSAGNKMEATAQSSGTLAGSLARSVGQMALLAVAMAALKAPVDVFLAMRAGGDAAREAARELRKELQALDEQLAELGSDNPEPLDIGDDLARARKEAEEELNLIERAFSKTQEGLANFNQGREDLTDRLGLTGLSNAANRVVALTGPVGILAAELANITDGDTVAAGRQRAADQGATEFIEATLAEYRKAQEELARISNLSPEERALLQERITILQGGINNLDTSKLTANVRADLRNTSVIIGDGLDQLTEYTDSLIQNVNALNQLGVEDLATQLDQQAQKLEDIANGTNNAIQRAQNDGRIDPEEAEARRLQAQEDRLKEQLQNERDQIRRLEDIATNSPSDDQRVQANERLSALRSQVIQTEGELLESQAAIAQNTGSDLLQAVEDNIDEQTAQINRGEQQKLLAIANAEAAGIQSAEQAAAERQKIAQDRIAAEIALEQRRIRELQSQDLDDGESEQQRLDQIQQAEDQILSLQLKAAEQRADAAAASVEAQVEAETATQREAVDAAIAAEREKQLEIANLLDQGVINQEEAERRKAAASVVSVNAQLEAERSRLEALEAQGPQTTIEAERARQEAIAESQSAIIDLVEQRIQTQNDLEREAVEVLKEAQQAAIAVIEDAELQRGLLRLERKQQLLAEGKTLEQVEEELQASVLESEIEGLRARLEANQQYLADLEALEAPENATAAEDREQALRDARQESFDLQESLLNREAELQAEIRQQVIDGINEEAEARKAALDLTLSSLQQQQDLLNARNNLRTAQDGLGDQRLAIAQELTGSALAQASIEEQAATRRLEIAQRVAEQDRESLQLAQERARLEATEAVAAAEDEVGAAQVSREDEATIKRLREQVKQRQQELQTLEQTQALERQTQQFEQEAEQNRLEVDAAQAAKDIETAITDALDEGGKRFGQEVFKDTFVNEARNVVTLIGEDGIARQIRTAGSEAQRRQNNTTRSTTVTSRSTEDVLRDAGQDQANAALSDADKIAGGGTDILAGSSQIQAAANSFTSAVGDFTGAIAGIGSAPIGPDQATNPLTDIATPLKDLGNAAKEASRELADIDGNVINVVGARRFGGPVEAATYKANEGNRTEAFKAADGSITALPGGEGLFQFTQPGEVISANDFASLQRSAPRSPVLSQLNRQIAAVQVRNSAIATRIITPAIDYSAASQAANNNEELRGIRSDLANIDKRLRKLKLGDFHFDIQPDQSPTAQMAQISGSLMRHLRSR